MVRNFVNFVIKNKLAVWLMTFIVLFYGMFSATQMKTETIPDISIPFLMVMDVYPGATPEQVMEDIAIPMEKVAENLDHVEAVYSNSFANMASLQIEYKYGIDMDEAKRELSYALEEMDLPEDAEKPEITAINMNMMPVVALSISSTTEDIVELTSTVEEMLLPKLRNLDGVAQATVTGQHIEEILITYDEEKLEQYDLAESDVKDMIQASDMAVPLGLYEFEEGEESVAVDGKFTSVKDLEKMLIPVEMSETNQVPFVELKEIAKVETVGKVQSISRTNGAEAIAIQVVKGQQANTVDVVNEVKDFIKSEQERIDGLVVDVSLDQGEPIEDSVNAMVEKAIFGALIAMLIILVFLRDFKSTIISVISIPVSIFMAFLLLHYLGITLNLMTLGAVTVAIGRVIDDSIVVVENIYRRIHLKEEKLSGRALIREATLEMFKPIASSTLVTVAVFAPLIFVGGMVGELFLPFALTMTFALGASLLVAVTIVPALSHTLFKKKLYSEKTEIKHKKAGKFTHSYRRLLEWTLNHKIITSTIAILLLLGSVALTPLIGFSFLGSEEEKMMYISYTPATGELESETLKNVTEVEEELMKHKDIEILQLSINNEADTMSMMMGGGANGGLVFITFDPDMKNFPEERDKIIAYLEGLDQSGEWKNQDFGSMGFASDEITYNFYSENIDRLNDAVQSAEKSLSDIEGIKDVKTSAEDAYVEHVFQVKQDELLQYGLTTGQIAMMLNPDSSKEVITTIEKDGNELEVIVQSKEEAEPPKTIDEILALEVPTAMGEMMPLSDLVEVKKGKTLNTLVRNKGQYHATVTGTITDQDISKAISAADKAIDKLDLPKGVTHDIGGVAADMEETFTKLILAMLAAILIVYFILVVTFNEGTAPFAVLFSLPFTVIGSFVGLLIAGETISVTVLMGLLMLIGIVVTNAIVLVDRIIRMEISGMAMRDAVLEAGITRLRPILMTAIATIGALIPLAVGESAGGSLISKDLAITVIGGLISSTVLTLIIVPIVYEILSKITRKNRKEVEEN